ncbi:MAG: right-handed parallel beta-helix repeat-containing protein, partial [Candidatus Aenigmarchaeota archaeon]|nr:right-handed parallel beta-helix repeat-containing protein [Candidatus Aenigmarchaeota archaeon]
MASKRTKMSGKAGLMVAVSTTALIIAMFAFSINTAGALTDPTSTDGGGERILLPSKKRGGGSQSYTYCSSGPDCTTKLASGDYAYVFLNADITNCQLTNGACITLGKDGQTFDGNGHFIDGPGSGTGVKIDGKSKTIVKNVDVKDFHFGVYAIRSNNAQIINNHIHRNINAGSGGLV